MLLDAAVIDTFCSAVKERLEGEEFALLMSGAEPPKGIQSTMDYLNLVELKMRDWEDGSAALRQLKAERALEELQGRYSDLWELAVRDGIDG